MSQAGTFSETSPGPTIDTLTGDTGGPVPPTGHNINIVGAPDSGLIVEGNPATSTLTIVAVAPFVEGTVTTTDATPTTIITLPLPPSSASVVEARIVGYTANSAIGGLFSFVARRNGGGAVVVGLPDYMKDVPLALPGATFDSIASGNNALLTVTGVAATTIHWKAHAEITQVIAP